MDEQLTNGLQALRDISLVPDSASCAQADDSEQSGSKPVGQPRREKTSNREDRSSMHSVFVLDVNGKPLTPTKPAKARKLLEEGKATKVWSKFGTFGIRINVPVETVFQTVAIGVDPGTKFEGYSVVVNQENTLNIKLDLPDKEQIRKKVEGRKVLRRARRHRKCRRRPERLQNRLREGFIAPSQLVIVQSRLKILRELIRIYPVSVCGLEDVKFDHYKKRWGQNFSTVEVGKNKIRQFLSDQDITLYEYQGFETSEYRQFYGYKKTSDKKKDCFESHCSDSLTLACTVAHGYPVVPGLFLVVDDTYRYHRRRLHDTQPAKDGIRDKFAVGTVKWLRKGLLVGTKNGTGRLCGMYRGSFRYCDKDRKRLRVKSLLWVSSSFIIRKEISDSAA